jgi:hypothetical protein
MSLKKIEIESDRKLWKRICYNSEGRPRPLSAAADADKNELYRRTNPPIIQGARKAFWEFQSSVDDSDEQTVIQEAARKIWQKLRTWDGSGTLAGWAYKISYNEAINFLKSWNTRLFTAAEDIEEAAVHDNALTADILHEAKQVVKRIGDFIRKVRNPLVGHVISGICNRKYRSVSDAANHLALYPRDIFQAFRPYMKKLYEILSHDSEVSRAILHLQIEAEANRKSLFPTRRYLVRRTGRTRLLSEKEATPF